MKVCTAYVGDKGKGIARMDYDIMSSLDVSTGDILEIKGERSTVVKCLPLHKKDQGNGIIRIDRLIRNNSGLVLGDIASLQKIKSVSARKVIISSHEEVSEIPGERVLDNVQKMLATPYGRSYLGNRLNCIPLIKGDCVWIPYFGNMVTFQITKVSPADATLVDAKTIFYFDDEYELIQNKIQEYV